MSGGGRHCTSKQLNAAVLAGVNDVVYSPPRAGDSLCCINVLFCGWRAGISMKHTFTARRRPFVISHLARISKAFLSRKKSAMATDETTRNPTPETSKNMAIPAYARTGDWREHGAGRSSAWKKCSSSGRKYQWLYLVKKAPVFMYFYVFTVPLPCDAGLALVAENCTAQQGSLSSSGKHREV